MANKRYWLRNAVWENHTKDKIKATLETVVDNQTTRQELIVNKFNSLGEINKDYQDIIDHVTIQRIDANTANIQIAAANKQRKEAQIKKDVENTRRLEQLFQMKIDAFEIPEVKESSNRVLKSKLRKSKNALEVQIYASVIAMEHIQKVAAEESTNVSNETSQVVEQEVVVEESVVNTDEQSS